MPQPPIRRPRLLAACGVIVLFLADAGICVAGGLYKWVDADGKIHFSDKPGAANAEEIKRTEPAKPEYRPTTQAARREAMNRLVESQCTVRESAEPQPVFDAVAEFEKFNSRQREARTKNGEVKPKEHGGPWRPPPKPLRPGSSTATVHPIQPP